MLQGRSGHQNIPPERLDWAGSGALLALYRDTSGKAREDLIHAIGDVIETHDAAPATIAQLIQIASGLDISQVEPQIRNFQQDPFGAQEPVCVAVINYLATRRINKPPTPITSNGKTKVSKRISKIKL